MRLRVDKFSSSVDISVIQRFDILSLPHCYLETDIIRTFLNALNTCMYSIFQYNNQAWDSVSLYPRDRFLQQLIWLSCTLVKKEN